MMYLVKYKDNWVDEFDVEGFRIFDNDELAEFYADIDDPEMFPNSFGFGTNQEIEYSTRDSYLSKLTIGQVTINEGKVLRKLFGGPEYGMFYYPEFPEDSDLSW